MKGSLGLEGKPGACEFTMEVNGENKQRRKREALVELKYERIGIKKTSIPGRTGKRYPKQLDVSVVRVQEKGETAPPDSMDPALQPPGGERRRSIKNSGIL
jgi:hypothetical protein